MEKRCDSVVRARIDGHTKLEATKALETVGLSISEYIRLSLMEVAREKSVRFQVNHSENRKSD